MYIPLCSPEQVGVIFQLLNKYAPESLEFDGEGGANVHMEKVEDSLLKRMTDQLDMWGIGYVSSKKK